MHRRGGVDAGNGQGDEMKIGTPSFYFESLHSLVSSLHDPLLVCYVGREKHLGEVDLLVGEAEPQPLQCETAI